MTLPPEIWLGDFARASTALGEDVPLQTIAVLLGLTAEPAAARPAGRDAGGGQTTATASAGTRATGAGGPATSRPSPETRRSSTPPPDDSVPMLRETQQAQAGTTDWAATPSLPLASAAPLAEPPPLPPLFAPRSTAAVLYAAAATMTDDGPVDVPALVRSCAQGRPVRRIPREPRLTLRFGTSVLVDTGEAMELFAHDQDELVRRISDIAGADTITVSYFADCPTRGAGPGSRRTWRSYRLPNPRCHVLIISDFGIGGPMSHVERSSPEEWRALVTTIRKANCSVTGLVPYPPSRWPAWLAALMPMLVWDRDTTAGQAATRMAGRASPVPRSRPALPSRPRPSAAPSPEEDLATALSVAVWIEPALIRAIRLDVYPYHGVAAEADLWFSDLVQSRGTQGILLDPGERSRLRANLARQVAEAAPGDAIRRVGDIIERVHAGLSPALLLEERVTWLAVCGQDAAIDGALRPALKAVAWEHRQGVAQWFTAAWNRIPEAARSRTTAWKLAQLALPDAESSDAASGTQVGLRTVDLTDIVDQLRDVRLLVRRAGPELEAGDAYLGDGTVGIMVPDSDPRILDVWEATATSPRSLRVRRGTVARLTVGLGALRLQNARGSIFELPAAAEGQAGVGGRYVGIAVTGDEQPGPAPSAAADIASLGSLLEEEFAVVTMADPTEAEVRAALRALRTSMAAGESLILAWAGHARLSRDSARLLASDSDRYQDTYQDEGAGILLEDVLAACASSGASQVLVILDMAYPRPESETLALRSAAMRAMREWAVQDGATWAGTLLAIRADTAPPGSLPAPARLVPTIIDLLVNGPATPELRARWSPFARYVRGDDLCGAVGMEWASQLSRPETVQRGSPWWMFPNPLEVPSTPDRIIQRLLLRSVSPEGRGQVPAPDSPGRAEQPKAAQEGSAGAAVPGGQDSQVGGSSAQAGYSYEPGSVSAAAQKTGQVVVGVIPLRPASFQPRPEQLAELAQTGSGVSVVQAITGLGGIGKTQLAAEYARSRVEEGWRLVAWVHADSPGSVLAGLAEIATALGLSTPGEDATALGYAVRRWLEADGDRCLVVFDNVEDVDQLRPFLPVTNGCQVVITSRQQAAAALGQAISLHALTTEEAVSYLTERTGLADTQGAAELANELGGLPLALAQAAAVISAEHLSYQTYLERLKSLSLAQYLGPTPGTSYPSGVAESVVLSLDTVAAADPGGLSTDLMERISLLSPAGVPQSLLHAATRAQEGSAHEHAVDEALARLAAASLLTFSPDGTSVSAHRLVMRVIRERMTAAGRLRAVAGKVARLLRAAAEPVEPWRDRSAARDLVWQVLALDESLGSSPDGSDATTIPLVLSLRGWALWCLGELGDGPGQAVALGQALIPDLQRELGTDDLSTLTGRNNLAAAYLDDGQPSEATGLLEPALDARQRLLGDEHLGTLTCRTNLASADLDNARLDGTPPDRATALLEQALAGFERTLGPDHPGALVCRSNLATAYQAAGRIDEAITVYQGALADFERVFGPDHPGTLTCYNNLATGYQDLGRADEATARYESALAGLERVLGPEHPSALICCANLAIAYAEQGRISEAATLYQRALAGFERVFGADRPVTVALRNNPVRMSE